MSGPHSTPAEHHLGDRLAALVDGELGHDARERVLAHLATCAKCKAEADAQRRLKNVFAEAAPPPPSESFLARLQGLPGSDDDEGDPFGGGGLSGGGVFSLAAAHSLNPLRPRSRNPFSLEASDTPEPALPDAEHGFRIHEVGRQDSERSASRGRRFAFAAAGAVSLAAIALGGVSAGVPTTAGGSGRGGGPSNATPLSATGPTTSAEAGRRRSAAQPAARSSERPSQGPATASAPSTASAPLLPGVPTPSRGSAPLDSTPLLSAATPLMQALPPSSYAPDSAMSRGASPDFFDEFAGQAPKRGSGIRAAR